MHYLIHPKDSEPFLTRYYDYANHFEDGMIVYNLWNQTYSTDGITWKPIEIEQL